MSMDRLDKRTAKAALGLRLAGASHVEIMEVLGLGSSALARRNVEYALSSAINDADVTALRAEEAARLERLLRSVWGKATDPKSNEHLHAVKVALQVIDRHSRLLGLDAPTEIVVHNPTVAEIDEWVASVVQTDMNVVEGEVID